MIASDQPADGGWLKRNASSIMPTTNDTPQRGGGVLTTSNDDDDDGGGGGDGNADVTVQQHMITSQGMRQYELPSPKAVPAR